MEKNLQKKMHSRHITMLALGGAIGAGLFKGSSEAISLAGPAVILAFLFGGLVLFVVMHGMGQLVLQTKKRSGLSGLIEPFLGKLPAHFIDWVYWSLWMINIIAEAVAAASFLQLWFPEIPAWLFVLLIALLTTLINYFSVGLFAETEYWLAFAKVAVIVLLIIFSLGFILQLAHQDGIMATLSRMNAYGGFAPKGFNGIVQAMLVVIYSYGGSELIAITVSETEHPEKAIPKAIKGVMGRIITFYVLPLCLLFILYPWTTLAHSQSSPFVMVFSKLHIPFATDVVNGVIVLALFSSINSGVYASSRTIYFRLKDSTKTVGKKLATLNKHQVPQRAVFFCTATLYLGVLLSYFLGDNLFRYLVGSLSYTVLAIWLLISFSAIILLKKMRQPFQLSLTVLAVLVIFAIFLGVLLTNSFAVTFLTFLLYLVIIVSYFFIDHH